MVKAATLHLRNAWRIFCGCPRVFVVSVLILFVSWVALELAVVALHRFGIVVWLVLHLAFFFFFSGLMLGLHEIALEAVDGKTPKLEDLTARLGQSPTFLLAFCLYIVVVLGGLALLIVPGIYLAVRYALFGQVLATRSTSPLGALRHSATLSHNHWWTVFALLLTTLVLNLAGAAILGLGLLITFPVSLLAMSGLYRSLERSTA